jgi:hypothetical protein
VQIGQIENGLLMMNMPNFRIIGSIRRITYIQDRMSNRKWKDNERCRKWRWIVDYATLRSYIRVKGL